MITQKGTQDLLKFSAIQIPCMYHGDIQCRECKKVNDCDMVEERILKQEAYCKGFRDGQDMPYSF